MSAGETRVLVDELGDPSKRGLKHRMRVMQSTASKSLRWRPVSGDAVVEVVFEASVQGVSRPWLARCLRADPREFAGVNARRC